MTFQNMIAECDTPTTEEAPPTNGGVPILPPIEECEDRPRKRRAFHCKVNVTNIWALGQQWQEETWTAKPGYKITRVVRCWPLDAEGNLDPDGKPSTTIKTKPTKQTKQAEQGDE
jgi:hypothetical protein